MGAVGDEAFAEYAAGLVAGTGIGVDDVAAIASGHMLVDGSGAAAAAALRDGWAAAHSAGRGVAS